MTMNTNSDKYTYSERERQADNREKQLKVKGTRAESNIPPYKQTDRTRQVDVDALIYVRSKSHSPSPSREGCQLSAAHQHLPPHPVHQSRHQQSEHCILSAFAADIYTSGIDRNRFANS